MATPLNKLAQYWRDDANNADLALTTPQRDALRECADELQQSLAQFRESKRFFANKKQTTNAFTAGDMADASSAGYAAAASKRDDLIVTMLAMLQDLHDGYQWNDLAIHMGDIYDHVAALGIEHEVSSKR